MRNQIRLDEVERTDFGLQDFNRVLTYAEITCSTGVFVKELEPEGLKVIQKLISVQDQRCAHWDQRKPQEFQNGFIKISWCNQHGAVFVVA